MLEIIRLPHCVELGLLEEFSPFGPGMSEGYYCGSEGIFVMETRLMCCDRNNMCWEMYYTDVFEIIVRTEGDTREKLVVATC